MLGRIQITSVPEKIFSSLTTSKTIGIVLPNLVYDAAELPIRLFV